MQRHDDDDQPARASAPRHAGGSARRMKGRAAALAGAAGMFVAGTIPAAPAVDERQVAPSPPTLEETRLAMSKWIETQQIISRERTEWQQGREILLGRLELVKAELASLQAKVSEAEAAIAEGAERRRELDAENEQLTAAAAQAGASVTAMEREVRRLIAMLPDPIRAKVRPLHQRIPEDPHTTAVSGAERFQNVLGILNQLNKLNNEITVSYEVKNLADGRPSEVRAIYVGLAQSYYVGRNGESGVGRPTEGGWAWESSASVGDGVLRALEILEGRQSPAFVALPVKLQ